MRQETIDHDPYCAVCSTYDEEQDVTTCLPGAGALIDCTFCNHARHINVCAKLPKHVTQTFKKSGKVPGAWACPECIAYARGELDLDPPPALKSIDDDISHEESDSDDDDSDSSDDECGIVMADTVDVGAETEMDSVDGVVFGVWSMSHMRMLLSSLPDFQSQKSRIHEVIESCGHICLFLSKFHCELNWIELYWCLIK